MGGISVLKRVVAPVACVLVTAAVVGCGPKDDASDKSPTGGDSAAIGNGATITIGKSYWHAGWKVDLTTAKVRASTLDPKQSVIAIDGMFNNLGSKDRTPDSKLTLEVDGESLLLDDGETKLPQVPAGGKQTGTIVFDLKDPAKVTGAVLVVGNPDNIQATVPFGASGTLVTGESRSIPLDLSASIKIDGPTGLTTSIKVKGAELRADDVHNYNEAKKGTVFLTFTYDVTIIYTCICAYGWDPEASLTLRLPDGTTVGKDPSTFYVDTTTTSGVAHPDLTTQFIIKDPAPGDYALVLRSRGTEKAMPFTIPAA